MSSSSVLRRSLACLVLLCGLLAGGHAWGAAPNCQLNGTVSVTLSPCPLTEDFKYRSESPVVIHVIARGPLPNPYYVALGASLPVVQPNTFQLEGLFNNFEIVFSTSIGIAQGSHSVQLDVKLCADDKCNKVLAEVGLPSTFDSVVPPAISSLSPSSSLLHGPAFTLKVHGSGFTKDCKIHLGTTVLTTTVVSAQELTARVDLSAVKKAGSYIVSVVPATHIASNAVHFILKNPAPTITALSPNTAPVSLNVYGTYPITVTGKGFMQGSKVEFDGSPLTTTFVSGTELTVSVTIQDSATGAAHALTVTNPTPGGGTSAPMAFTLLNNTPAITSLSPTKIPVVALATSGFTVQGTGLQYNSVLTVGGVVCPFFYSVNGTQTSLIASIPANAFSVGANLPVVVTNPTPGGGTSNTLTMELDNSAPSLHWISPVQAYAGSGDMVLTVRASNLNSATQLEWNGTPLQNVALTSNFFGQFLQATIPAASLATAGNATVALVTPGPGGGTSSATLAVVTHPPEIDSLNPGFVATGGGDFTLTLDGQDFDASATVFWNGDQLTVTQVSANEIQVTVPAAEIAAPGVAKLTVVNPDAAGGTSAPATFAVDDSGTSVIALAQPVNDIEWDPWQFQLYGTTHAADANHPHAVLSLDPVAAGILASTNVQFSLEGHLLSLSGDGRMLYVSLPPPQGVARYAMPGFTYAGDVFPYTGGSFAQYASGIRASPLYSHVVVATILPNGLASSNHGASVMDDADDWTSYFSQNETWDAVAWSPDGLSLYGGDTQDSPKSLMTGTYGFTTTGTQSFQSTGNLWAGGPMHVDAASGFIYADNSPSVIDPAGPSVVGTFPVSGVMIPDSTLGCAYFITQTAAQVTAAAGDWTLSCYSTTDETLTRSLVIPAVQGTPTKMLRWGNEGLAFITDGGYIYFVSGQVVTGN